MSQLNEKELPDDYPVYWDYLYVADGKVIQSDIQGTVRELKTLLKVKSLTNCDIYGRSKQGAIKDEPTK